MSTTTRTPDLLRAEPSSTSLEVRADPDGGPVHVRVRTHGTGPRLRAMVTATDRRTAAVSLVPDGALLLAGDDVSLRCDVGPGVDLVLTEPGGTVAYPMSGDRAAWSVEIRVDAGGGLRWHGQPFVAAEGADVERSLRVDLAGDARLLLRETMVLGRHAEGPGRIRTGCTVTCNGRDLLRDDLDLGPHSAGPGLLGGHRVLDQVLAVGLDDLPATTSRMDLAAGGTLYRALCPDAHLSPLGPVWEAAVRGWVSR